MATTGAVTPRPKGGGWTSPIDTAVVEVVVGEVRDSTLHELCAEYNRRVPPRPADRAVGVPSRAPALGLRAQKKRPRPSEIDRPDVAQQRGAFL